MRPGKWSFLSSLFGAVFGSALTLALLFYGIVPLDFLKLPSSAKEQPVVQQAKQPETIRQIVEVKDSGEVYKEVIKTSMPSVVGITTTSIKQDAFFRNIARSGVGTGVIVDSKGYILTNSHVVDDGRAEEVNVIFSDGETMAATVLWSEKELDLAVIKVQRDNLPVAILGDSDKVEVGDIAIAIGNPLGLQFDRSVTQGIISGLNRSIEVQGGFTIEELIQTDASINEGNSGGPLLNSKGEVIGINSAKVQSAEGLGFAIPINISKPIVDEFIENGEFRRVYLGIRRPLWIDINYYNQFMGKKIESEAKYGVYVESVVPDSPAAQAGLMAGDIITELDGEKLDTKSKLIRILYKQRPGRSANMVFIRDGREVAAKVEF